MLNDYIIKELETGRMWLSPSLKYSLGICVRVLGKIMLRHGVVHWSMVQDFNQGHSEFRSFKHEVWLLHLFSRL